MAEFFSTLVPSGPGHLGALATQAAAGMVSFHGPSSSSPDSSASPGSGSGGDASDASPAKGHPGLLYGGLPLHHQHHQGGMLAAPIDSKTGLLMAQPAAYTFPQFAAGVPALAPMAEAGNEGSPDGLLGGEDDGDDDDDALDGESKSGGRRGLTGKAQKQGLNPNRQSLTTAERRATHNAIERARRESLNGRFMQLAASLPSMANVKRPSKSIIVNKSLEFIQESLIRDHTLVKENTDLRREVDELRARLGMPPLPPAAPAGTFPGGGLVAAHHGMHVAAPQLIHPHMAAAPGAATMPPEMPTHPAAIHPAYGMHIPLRAHPGHHPAVLAGMPAFSIHPHAAALLSPAMLQHHPGPHMREDPFAQHAYAGAIMGNPPAMASPPVNAAPSFFSAQQQQQHGATTPRPKDSTAPASPSKKRPSPEAEEQSSGSNKKRAVAASDEAKDMSGIKVVRSGSISSESSSTTSSASVAGGAAAANVSPFSNASSLGALASSHGHSLSALGIEVPISQAFGNAMAGLGLSAAPDGHAIFGAVPTSAGQPWSGIDGGHLPAVSAGGNPFGLM